LTERGVEAAIGRVADLIGALLHSDEREIYP
jgi:hypothetical protein